MFLLDTLLLSYSPYSRQRRGHPAVLAKKRWIGSSSHLTFLARFIVPDTGYGFSQVVGMVGNPFQVGNQV